MGKPGDKRQRRAKKRRQADARRQATHAREARPPKPEPTLEALKPRLKAAAAELVAETREQQERSSGCHFPEGGFPRRVRRDACGWSFITSSHVHPHDGGEAEHWHLSVMLQPAGRSSKPLDWQVLGFMVAEVYSLTGYQLGPEPPDPLTLIEVTSPNRVHHWAWHADGSKLDPAVESQLRKMLNPPAGEA